MNVETGLEKLQALSQKLAPAASRLSALFDDGSFTELYKFTQNGEAPLGVCAAYGTIDGVLTFAFMQSTGADGAFGRAMAQKISKVYELAGKMGAPVVALINNGGAHIAEGIDAMEAYATLTSAAAALSGVVPQITVVLGDCIGSAAVLASMADVVIMTEGAQMYVTPGSVLHNEKVGSASVAAENGTAALVVADEAAAFTKVAELITFLPQNNLSLPLMAEYVPAAGTVDGTDPYEVIAAVCDKDSFCELYPDHAKRAVVGFARVNGAAIAVAATNTKSKKLPADAASKMARFVRLCDAFSLPIVTFLDAEGIMGNAEDELSGGVKCAAQLCHAYAEATAPKITVITGAACGAAYMALASRACGIDSVFAWTTAYISAMEPEAAVQFLKQDDLKTNDREDVKKAYIDEEASAFEAAKKGFVEDVINPLETAPKLSIALDMLSSKRVSTLDKKHSNIQL